VSSFQLLVWVAVGVLSCVLTYIARRYALRMAILDVPCPRSSHAVPTPRGGGLPIMAVALGGISIAGMVGVLPANLAIGFVGGGALIAWVGWMDDRRELPARTRLFVHLMGSLWFIGWLGGVSSFTFGPFELRLGVLGTVLAAFMSVWFVNLYNFMDGIDGLAGGQAVTGGTLGGLMLLALGSPALAIVAFCIAAASAGFLVWNWAPAKIFMGDAGSGLLGFLFVALAFASEAAGAVPFVAWIVLFGAFVFDTTTTLARRIMNGDRWREGHRLHAYQRAVQRLGGRRHSIVALLILLLTLPLAAVAWLLTVEPALYLVLLAGAMLEVTAVYLAVEWLAPMYPSRGHAIEAAIGASGLAEASDGQERVHGGVPATAAQDAHGSEIGDRPYPGRRKLRPAGGWLNSSSPVKGA
jgi:Fuc2NAc and GlcNAc transferase